MSITDAEIGAAFRGYVVWWARGTLDDLYSLYEDIAEAEQTGFPWQPAVETLSHVKTRRLWRALDSEELQDLFDWANEAGLDAAAGRFSQAEQARPYIDEGHIPREVRQLVMERDDGRCQYCGGIKDLTIDHKLIPWSDGGSSTDAANLQVLCRTWNSRKGTKPWPLEGEK